MANNNEKINDLLDRLEILQSKQDEVARQIFNIKGELIKLKREAILKEKQETPQPEEAVQEVVINENQPPEVITPIPEIVAIEKNYSAHYEKEEETPIPKFKPLTTKSDFEKFIGENLINKIGIIITIIGVGIGAKYSIDNDLISPLTRIILGYLCGLGLLVFGYRLKSKYQNYSAVLVSGAMAIMYFITYFAYGLYALIPQVVAFALMVIFTIFTVLASLTYDKKVIAFLGLIGAYLVPFMLSNDSGNVLFLFTYIAIINAGILAIAVKKNWKILVVTSFVLTWLIYLSWYLFDYEMDKHFILALSFGFVFFMIFYLAFLGYKIWNNQKFTTADVILIMLNAFIYFGLGYGVLELHNPGNNFLGLFTIFNAVVHFIISAVIYRKNLGDKNLYYFILGLVLVFVTIAIPIQLDGNWVSLLWAGEAALLFWIGSTKKVILYENLSYVMILLAFMSLLEDWGSFDYLNFSTTSDKTVTPIFNIGFLTSMLCVLSFGFITYKDYQRRASNDITSRKGIYEIISYTIPGIFIFCLYYAFKHEIALYWDQCYAASQKTLTDTENQFNFLGTGNPDIKHYKDIWVVNYSLTFVSLLVAVNLYKIKNKNLAFVGLALSVLALFAFLIQGLYVLSELRESYLDPSLTGHAGGSVFNLWVRYISFVFVVALIWINRQMLKRDYIEKQFTMPLVLLFYATILWVASSELIHWLDLLGSKSTYKLGLSILWGVYALILIGLGIWKNKSSVRIFAIALFAITLLKLFFFDLSELSTISKTIVFLALGVLLLIISFLYNKYTNAITEED